MDNPNKEPYFHKKRMNEMFILHHNEIKKL